MSTLIRIRLKEVLAEKEFHDGRVITLNEVSKATGIHRATLSKIANEKGCNTGTDNIDALCNYFECRVEDLLVHLPEPVPKVD
jgi:DNA-binding Xre family transcriptional regulator